MPSQMTWKHKHVVWMSDPQRKGSHSAPGWALLKKDAADSGWDGVEALAGNQGYTAFLRLRRGQNPDHEEIAFAPAGIGGFNIDGHSHIVVRGFTIRNAWSAVRITNGASDNIVEKNALRGGRYILLVERGAARNRIQHNDWLGGEGVRKLQRMGGHNVLAPGQRLWDPMNPDFRLSKDSPARHIGIDLSRPFTVNGVEHPPLPGMAPGYFPGERPDAGAVQFESPESRAAWAPPTGRRTRDETRSAAAP